MVDIATVNRAGSGLLSSSLKRQRAKMSHLARARRPHPEVPIHQS